MTSCAVIKGNASQEIKYVMAVLNVLMARMRFSVSQSLVSTTEINLALAAYQHL